MENNKTPVVSDLILERFPKGNFMCSWLEADGVASYLVIESEIFGLGYGVPYIDVRKMPRTEEELAALKQILICDCEPLNEEDLTEFSEDYRSEAESCNTAFRGEFLQLSERLKELIAKQYSPRSTPTPRI